MSADTTTWQAAENLYLIGLQPPLPGFDRFIGIWLHTGSPSFLVDVGPSATSAALFKALEEIGVRHLDYLLLTHIHIDHAGGIGAVAAAFPQATVIGHPEGLPHLLQPDRLWAGSLKSLGRTAEAYGAIQAVAEDRVMATDAFHDARLRVIPTPGHSPHHVSYLLDDLLFAGEAGGVCLAAKHSKPYMRPATPPRFFLEVALASIDRLIARAPQKIAYSHFGLFTEAGKRLKSHRRQLQLWEDIIGRTLAHFEGEDLTQTCMARLLEEDARLEALDAMTAAEINREHGFLRNSIQGFIGYLREGSIRS
jgi:glyoxylase-like metal-dependent hydrolase (beta-lactamase superfamily II)